MKRQPCKNSRSADYRGFLKSEDCLVFNTAKQYTLLTYTLMTYKMRLGR